MILIKPTFQILVVSLITVPIGTFADSWSCSHDNDVREVHIERSTSESVPCDVVYRKLTEGVEDQILWNAQNDDSYCDEKATEFIEKLGSWGWVCAETIRDSQGDASTGSGT